MIVIRQDMIRDVFDASAADLGEPRGTVLAKAPRAEMPNTAITAARITAMR
jgi:hypothetical protein